MQRLDRAVPLPLAMQGRWVDMDDPRSFLTITGGEITCFGQTVDYQYKVVEHVDDALTVNLETDNEANEDEFQRANITGLVITPDGAFRAYNVRSAIQLRRDGP